MMKNIVLLGSALLLLSFTGCNSSENPREKRGNEVHITGQVENPGEKSVMLGRSSLLGERQMMDTASLNDKQFALNFELEEPGYYVMRYGRMPIQLFLRPGDSLKLTMDAKNFPEDAQYTGLGAELNNYFLHNQFRIQRPWYKTSEDEFVQKLDSVKSAYMEKWNAFVDTAQDVPEMAKKMEEQRIEYKWAGQMMVYPRAHRYFTKKQDFEVSKSFDKQLEQLSMNDSMLLHIPEFRRFVSEYVNKKVGEEMPDDANKEGAKFQAGFEAIEALTDNEAIRDYARFSLLNQNLEQGKIKGMKSYLDKFEEDANHQPYVSKLKKQYSEWEGLAEGKKAPVFEYPDTSGKTVSLEDFRGQYVYIDVWASWCRPCLQQIPQLKSLKEQYKDQNIAIVSVSIDEEKDSWKKMLKQRGLGGNQLIAEKGFNAKICKDYKISGIPRFILIDKQGKIIDVNAPRPTQNIQEVLNNLEGIKGKPA